MKPVLRVAVGAIVAFGGVRPDRRSGPRSPIHAGHGDRCERIL